MKTIIKVACLFCGVSMGEKDGGGIEGTSHSICPKCWVKHWHMDAKDYHR